MVARMSHARPITVPSADSLAKKIRERQSELRALRKLFRLARAAEEAQSSRRGVSNVE
jgi:hypothetical protein